METTRDNHSPYGRPMDREREGHGGGGQLFAVRREAHLERGLLCEKGHNDNYLIFRPSDLFVEVLGDDVLRFNEALFEFRGQVVKHLSVLGAEGLRGHYAELDRRVDVVRDRLLNLTDYCHKGFDGKFEKALDGVEPSEGEGLEKAGEDDADVFEGVRQRNVDEGILTELGRARGYVGFQSCPLYGRVVGEIIYTLNDALWRMQDRTSFYLMGAELEYVEMVERYYGMLRKDMTALRGELEEVVEFCRRKVG